MDQKTPFTKEVQFCRIRLSHKVNLSFGQEAVISSLSNPSNQKTSFAEVVQFGMLLEYIIKKVKVKLLFGHKPVILSLSK